MTYALDTQDVDLAFTLFCQLPAEHQQINELVVFDPMPLLALPGAEEHPGWAVALFFVGARAWYRDADARQALSWCDKALEAQQRLGPAPGEPIEVRSPVLRSEIAHAAGSTQEAVEYVLDGARRAAANDLPARAAILLGDAAQTLAWSDPAAARQHASEGLTLARQSGNPYAIAFNLQGLAQALARSDPDQARALLAEALHLSTTLGYESPGGLITLVFVAALLQEWSAMLRAASRVLHHEARTGTMGLLYVAAILNLAARGLVERQPEPAAVVQGAVIGMVRRFASDEAASDERSAQNQNEVAEFVSAVRRDTTQLLATALGQTRLGERSAPGATMDQTQACIYASNRINEYLDRQDDETN